MNENTLAADHGRLASAVSKSGSAFLQTHYTEKNVWGVGRGWL